MALTKKISKTHSFIGMLIIATFIGAVSNLTTPYMAIATLAYLFMIAGMIQRRNRELHPRLMMIAMGIDLSLVLSLEFQRDAIKTALDMQLGALQQAHILFSTLALVLYFPIAILGFLRWREKLTSPNSYRWHKGLGFAAFLLRSMGFLLMFSLLS